MSSNSKKSSKKISSAYKPIQRTNVLSETIVEQITNLIFENKLQPGDPLVETTLAEEFEVSRIPVREALQVLERYGLVQKDPYKLAVVSSIQDDDIKELHEVRLLIEPWAAKNLAAHGSPESLKYLLNILDSMKLAAKTEQIKSMVDLDLRFHNNLVTLNNNKLLNELWSLVTIRFHRFLMLKERRLYDNLESAVEHHAPIIDAIIARDQESAEVVTIKHIEKVYQVWKNDLSRSR